MSEEDKAVVDQMKDQSKTDSTLPDNVKIKPIDQEVQSDELLSTDQKLIDDPLKVDKGEDIQSRDQAAPEKFDAAQYEATADVADCLKAQLWKRHRGPFRKKRLLLPLPKNLIHAQPHDINSQNYLKASKMEVRPPRGPRLLYVK